MGQKRSETITDEEIDEMLERAKAFDTFPRVVEAVYRPADAFLMLRLSDGRRLLVPRGELDELKNATDEQAMEIILVPTGTGIWWPQIDDGCTFRRFWSTVGVRTRRRPGCSGPGSRRKGLGLPDGLVSGAPVARLLRFGLILCENVY